MAETDYKEAIKKVLKAQRRPLTTLKIAKKTDITWPTAIKYLAELKTEGYVHYIIKGKKKYWHLVATKGGNEIMRIDLGSMKLAKKPGKGIRELKVIRDVKKGKKGIRFRTLT